MGRAVWVLAIVAMICAGCGEVEWFPTTEKSSTSPTAFSFNPATKIDVNPGDTVTSDAITISGIESVSAKIRVSGDASSKYSINSAVFTNISGTIKNNDKVSVQHTSSSQLGTTVRTTLTIGDRSADFSSTTANVRPLTFTAKTNQPTNIFVFSDPQTVDGINGPFTISVTGGQYAITTSATTDCSTLSASLFTEVQGSIADNQVVCLRNTTSLIANSSVTTTLIIGGVQSTFTSTTAP